MEMDRMAREARDVSAYDRDSRLDHHHRGDGASSRLDDRGHRGESRLADRSLDRHRGRSPDPDRAYAARSAIEIAELQDKLEKTSTELRRAQAELRLNQSDYERSHVELEQMQEKVR